jgi:hypothetical protein
MDDGVGGFSSLTPLLKRHDFFKSHPRRQRSPHRTRGPSSPACIASFSVRVDTLEVLHLEHLDRTSHT